MSTALELTDDRLLDLMRSRGTLSVAEGMTAGGVTATAVRQRLTRLMRKGLVERITQRHGRGRPEHRYSLTELARRQTGHNYTDLSLALWQEIRGIRDPEVRRGLLQRVAGSLSQMYRNEVVGTTTESRMHEIQELLADRRVPAEVVTTSTTLLPVLKVVACPYPELAAQDRSICAMEKMMFADLLQTPISLTQCRLDGHDCCHFETHAGSDTMADLVTADG